MRNFLISFQFPANTGFAIEPLEMAFFEAISSVIDDNTSIHLSYTGYPHGPPRWLQNERPPLVLMNYGSPANKGKAELAEYIRREDIGYVFAFDMPVDAPVCRVLRTAGVDKIISYWGAPMSSLNSGLKLLSKQLQVALLRNRPDHFIFESYGMQKTATHGRGIRSRDTSVVRLGISVEDYSSQPDRSYVFRHFSIPGNRHVFFYAGHMEARKGVDVIIRAATDLVNTRGRSDVHFLLCGNRKGEEEAFFPLFRDTRAEDHITFAGYREDIPHILPGCYAGVIASTGWDSFPRTSLEMAAAGLPLLVSDLLGLNETVVDQLTGRLFPPGDHSELADQIEFLIKNPRIRNEYGENGFQRVRREFSIEKQIQSLREIILSQVKEA